MAAASGHDLRKQPIYPLPQSKNEGRRELEDQSGNQRDPLQDAEGTWDSIFTGSKVLAALASVALLVLLAVVFLGLLFIALALAIGAIIIGQKYQNENCLEDYEGVICLLPILTRPQEFLSVILLGYLFSESSASLVGYTKFWS